MKRKDGFMWHAGGDRVYPGADGGG
jgi:hypothetical protein